MENRVIQHGLLTEKIITAVINVHNGEKFLDAALLSILNQSLAVDKLLVINNASTDKTSNILERYGKDIDVITLEFKIPLYSARNLALKTVDNGLLAFCDSDDIWEKDKLALQVPEFRDSVVAVYSNATVIDHFGNQLRGRYIDKSLPSGNISKSIFLSNPVCLSSLIIDREKIPEDLKFNPKLNLCGDYDFLIYLAHWGPIIGVDKPLVRYRDHSEGLSKKLIHTLAFELRALEKSYKDDPMISSNPLFVNFKNLVFRARVSRFLRRGKINAAFFLMLRFQGSSVELCRGILYLLFSMAQKLLRKLLRA